MPLSPPPFAQILSELEAVGTTTSFDYDDPTRPFTKHVRREVPPGDAGGIYILTATDRNEVIYIGKAGTVRTDGTRKRQSIRERLTAPRGGSSSDTWFADAANAIGPFRVTVLPTPPDLAPGYVEVLLLQAFLTEHGRLPSLNRSF